MDQIRRRMVNKTLVSVELRNAIEVILRGYRQRGYRWNELPAEAEDVRSEVAVRALDQLDKFNPARSPLPWLVGIAVNVIRERARWYGRNARRHLHQSACTPEQWQDLLDTLRTEPRTPADPSPVWQAFQRLRPEEQQTLRLRWVEDRPYSEIAHILGISEQAARQRTCRALQALRNHFQDPDQGRDRE
jgi:RNA polymerase sigma-70 factor (ECF subfamily)